MCHYQLFVKKVRGKYGYRLVKKGNALMNSEIDAVCKTKPFNLRDVVPQLFILNIKPIDLNEFDFYSPLPTKWKLELFP